MHNSTQKPVMPSLASWYADGFRWIVSLFTAAERHEPKNVVADARLRAQSTPF